MSVTRESVGLSPEQMSSAEATQAIDVRQLGKQMDLLLRGSVDSLEATRRFVSFTRKLAAALAVLHYANDSTGQLAADPICHDPEHLADATLNQLFALAARAQQQQTVQLAQGNGDDPRLAMALPVFCRDGQVEVLLVVIASGKQELGALAVQVQLLQFIASFLGQWRGAAWGQAGCPTTDASRRCLATMSLANRAELFADSARQVAVHFADRDGTQRAAILLRRTGGLYRIVALGPELHFERGAPLVTLMESVAGEADALGETYYVDLTAAGTRETDASCELLAMARAQALLAVPIRDAKGATQGIVLLLSESGFEEEQRNQIQEDVELLGPHLLALRDRRVRPLQQLRRQFAKLSAAQRRASVIGIAALVLAACVVPIPYRVKCSCELQPVSRRYITAPYEGVLKETLVSPGEMVAAGQVLARMDDTELLFKRDAIVREIKSWENKATGALAVRESDKHLIARLERETKEADLKDVDRMLSQLEIKSPLEGYVISGDLERLEGAHLSVGQTLFEVGPRGQMLVEVAIPDQEINRIGASRPVSVRLDALPFTTFDGTLTSIAPRSEIRANKNVFIGQVALEGVESTLRPGMRGHAKIKAGYRPLVWIAFHRAVERVLFRFGW